MSPDYAQPAHGKSLPILLLILAALAGAVCFFYHHDPVQFKWYPGCPLHQVTGLHCPGCGGTRAMYALLHGDLAGASRDNLLLLFALPAGAILGATTLLRHPPSPRVWACLGGLLLAAALIFGILRNLPFPAFEFLRPE